SEISCMACHGAAFNKIFDRWKSYTSDRLKGADTLLADAEKQLSEPYPQSLLDAQDNLRLIHRAVPVHNVDYSLALLDKSVELMNAALKERGKAAITAPWRTFPYNSPCLSCHQGIENQTGTFRGKPFVHFAHVIKNELDCETCHVPHEIPPKKFPIAEDVDCASCHHDATFEAKCKTCHAEDIAKTVTVRGQVLDRKGLGFVHEMHLEATEKKCVDCHFSQGKFVRTPPAALCSDCHS
ncbi:MAG TPA: cytochrome c3 family protein, partial [Acidobacteriota bacterium]|nr:cytochrome c3 family protein [Acidobacteriota bacterium]